MSEPESISTTKERFLLELRHHFNGWFAKVTADFSEASFLREQELLKGDPVYSAFGFASPEYALVRLMGRVSISIGRRLGEIYDKMPRFIAQARFQLSASDVAPIVNKELELDVCIPLGKLNPKDRQHVAKVAAARLPRRDLRKGLGIEIRYNFNPNDSSRLRKDVRMAELLAEIGLTGIYLMFSQISPREEAIARLKRAGWTFFVGSEATEFMNELIGMDLGAILTLPEVKEEVAREVKKIMDAVYKSPAMKAVAGA